VTVIAEPARTRSGPGAAQMAQWAISDALVMTRRNLLVWGLGGVIVPFAGIKLIDLIMVGLHLVA